MALTDVQICNLAIDSLKGQRIVALGESTANGTRFAQWYAQDRDELLSRYPWTFAIKRASLAAHATAPAYEYDLAFPVPGDCLSPWTLEDWRYADAKSPLENHHGLRCILSNLGAPLRLRYIAQITNTGLFHPLFVKALVKLLAYDTCFAITGSMGAREQIMGEFREILSAAMESDAIAGGDAEFLTDDWLSARV